MSELTDLKIDFAELEEQKRRNFRERLKFIDWYAEWLKKTPNEVWSKAQNAVVEQFPKYPASRRKSAAIKTKKS
ncbi:MAG: hypothetical protein Q8R15_05275 [Candidatus Micrarchaeota archaeon]|nr:hypothetical protein [Candidatus Micrarchaeota archaeon]